MWPLGAELGEGPVWSEREAALWFVDIKGRALHRFRPGDGTRTSLAAPDQPGFAWPAEDGRLVVGLPRRLACCDPVTGEFSPLAEIEPDRPGNRINDASVDLAGRLWFGTMDDAESLETGALYSWSGALRRHDDGIAITNGPCVSPDGRKFYHTDTLNRVLYAYDLDSAGMLSNKRELLRIEADAGWPDGTTIDAEGCLWVALWGGWAVRRYSPDGRLIDMLRLPCANVTKVAFGGADRRDFFITTAAKGLSPAERAAQPLAGGLFFLRAGVSGLPVMEAQIT